MPKLKHKKPKTGVISVRVDPKLRYGLDLAARQQHISVSDAVVQAVVGYLESKGLMERQPGEIETLLDKLWNESETARIENLFNLAPGLMTGEEKAIWLTISKLREKLADTAAEAGEEEVALRPNQLDELMPHIRAVVDNKEPIGTLFDAAVNAVPELTQLMWAAAIKRTEK